MIEFPEQFFVTGTGTDVGKTVATGILLRGLKATFWKPIQSGQPTDTNTLKQITGLEETHFLQEHYKFNEPASPHLAAHLEGRSIDMNAIHLPPKSAYHTRHLIVEGAGGLMVPLNSQDLMIDLIKQLGLPVIVVGHSTLGTINHTLLSVHELQRRKIPILGVVMNGPPHRSNKEAIEHFGKVKVIAQIPTLPELTPQTLESTFLAHFGEHNVSQPIDPNLPNLASIHANENGATTAQGS